jgi:hypothetical protein
MEPITPSQSESLKHISISSPNCMHSLQSDLFPKHSLPNFRCVPHFHLAHYVLCPFWLFWFYYPCSSSMCVLWEWDSPQAFTLIYEVWSKISGPAFFFMQDKVLPSEPFVCQCGLDSACSSLSGTQPHSFTHHQPSQYPTGKD